MSTFARVSNNTRFVIVLMTFLYSYISNIVSAGGMSACVLPLQKCECCLLFRLKLFFFLPVFILQTRQVHCVTGDINVHGTQ